jgi:hypothetical protein
MTFSRPRRIFGLALLLLLAGCAVQAPAPAGFAPWPEDTSFRAADPAGVMYRVRKLANDPKADLAFWSEASFLSLREKGCRPVDTLEVSFSGTPARALECAMPVGPADWLYLVAVGVKGDEIWVAEATGEASKFQTRRPALLEALKGVAAE